MSSFGQVIPVVGTKIGFLGEVSRSADNIIISKMANALNLQNILFGDAVVIIPDSTGGTCKQFADFLATGGGLPVTTATASSVTATPVSLNGLSAGMLVQGAGIPAGTFIVSVNYAAGTITLSKAATATAGAAALTYGLFGGFAVRETKTQFGYPYAPNAGGVIGAYRPGDFVGIVARGAITLKVNVGTPLANGPAYIRAILNGSIAAGLVGGLETVPDTVNNLLLPTGPVAQAYFKSGTMDADGMTEVSVLSRIAA